MSQSVSYNSLVQRIKELKHENTTLKQDTVTLKKFWASDKIFGSPPAEFAAVINQKIEKERGLLLAAVEQSSEMVYITNSEGMKNNEVRFLSIKQYSSISIDLANKRVNRTARVSFFLKVEKIFNDVLSINFIGNPCRPLPKCSLQKIQVNNLSCH